MKPGNKNSYKALKSLIINGKNYKYYSLVEAEKNGLVSYIVSGDKDFMQLINEKIFLSLNIIIIN